MIVRDSTVVSITGLRSHKLTRETDTDRTQYLPLCSMIDTTLNINEVVK